MFAISYIFAYSFNIVMCVCHTIVPACAPPDPVWVLYSSSDDTNESVSYNVFLHGGCPKDTRFGGSMIVEFARFICPLEFDSSEILEKTLLRLFSSICLDSVFFSLVEDL